MSLLKLLLKTNAHLPLLAEILVILLCRSNIFVEIIAVHDHLVDMHCTDKFTYSCNSL